MDESEKNANTGVTSHIPRPRPKSYAYLIRISRQLGSLATRSIIDARSMLHYGAIKGSAHRLMASMPYAVRRQDDSSQQTVGAGNGAEVTSQTQSSAAVAGESVPQVNQSNSESDEQKKDEGDEELDASSGLEQAVRQSHEVLASANTVFPVKLFPDTVFVDRTKVTIIRRNFFWSSDTMSIRIEDVLNVSASVGPLFGSLTIASRVMSTIDHFRINHFWRNDAINLKHVIQGYVIAQHNHLDTKHLSKDELVKTLIEIGHDANT